MRLFIYRIWKNTFKCGDEMKKKKKNVPMNQEDKLFFRSFYDEYKKYMYYLAGKYTTIIEDREDLVQETIIRLMNNISVLRQLNRYKIAKYISLTVKSAYLDNEKIKKKDALLFFDDANLEAIMIEQPHMAASNQIIAASHAVSRLKKELPARDWLVLDAKYILGLSQEEISNLIGVAPDSVRMVLYRARKKAKLILENETAKGGEQNG